jgi:hypothetical protein
LGGESQWANTRIRGWPKAIQPNSRPQGEGIHAPHHPAFCRLLTRYRPPGINNRTVETTRSPA